MKDEITNTADVADLENREPSQTINGQRGEPRRVYLTTPEAVAHLRKSVSWLLRHHDMPFLPGNPNIYKRSDLDEWFERSKVKPRVD